MRHTSRPHVLGSAFVVSALLGIASPSIAQCTNPWPVVPGSPGVEGDVSDMLVFDPDGTGPLGEHLLVAGNFQVAGTVAVSNLAVYDPATRTWASFGPGPHPSRMKLAKAPNGDIFVGGNFTSIAGTVASRVARWNGTTWSALGTGVDAAVHHMLALPNGDLVVTGAFNTAGGMTAETIARWDGTAWSSIGATTLPPDVDCGSAVVMPNGDLCVAAFHPGAASNFNGVLRFDGTTWSQVGGSFGVRPWKLLVLPSGELVAGSSGIPGDATQKVARWNGATWIPLPGVPIGSVSELAVLPSGVLVASGRFESTGAERVATWDGISWTPLGECSAGNFGFGVMEVAGGDLFYGGGFAWFDGRATSRIARWNGTAWSATNNGLMGSMRALAVLPNGATFVGSAGGALDQDLVHRWNGAAWSPIGGGFNGSENRSLTALVALPSGALIAGGRAGSAPGPWPLVQRWTGSTWTTIGATSWGSVTSAVELPNGDLVVGGAFAEVSGVNVTNVARFDGTNWFAMGSIVLPNLQTVNALVVTPAGDLLAMAGTAVFRWNGTAWMQLGLATSSVGKSLVIGSDGAPILAGDFAGPDVLRWNGVAWAPLGNGPAGPVQSLAVLPNGHVVAGPFVNSSNPGRPLERWDGSVWSPLGTAVDATVWSMQVALNGDLLLSGDFLVANGDPRVRFARVSTSCPASVATLPANCGWSQPLPLVVNTLPWLGGTCRATASNLPANSLVVIATGVAPASVPLSSLLPVPTAGCLLLLVPDALALAIPVAAVVRTDLAIPNATALVGASLRQQVLALSIDGTGALTSVRASNALEFVIGSF